MKEQIIPIILGILLIGIVSAGVTIAPSSISINAFPGETHQVNITIKADGNYLLIFNSTDSKITITPESMATINGEKKTKINLTFAKDISLGVHTFDVEGSTEVITVEVPVYRGGGTKYVDRNITIEKEVEKIIYVNQTEELEEPIEIEKDRSWVYILCGLLFLAIIFMWYKVLKKEKDKANKK